MEKLGQEHSAMACIMSSSPTVYRRTHTTKLNSAVGLAPGLSKVIIRICCVLFAFGSRMNFQLVQWQLVQIGKHKPLWIVQDWSLQMSTVVFILPCAHQVVQSEGSVYNNVVP